MEVIDLINLGERAAAEEYIAEAYSPEFKDAFPMTQHIGVFGQLHNMWPDLELAEVIESGETSIKALLKSEPANLWLDVSLEVESHPPHRISRMGVAPGSAPEGHGGSRNTESAIFSLEDLESYLSDAESAETFSGVVMVARNGAPVFQGAYGLACKNHNVPNELDTKFNLGSINKLFTGVAAAKLMQEGRLGLDDPIGRYLDDFPDEAASKVTIKHLLQMSSGWGDYWNNETYLSTRFDLRRVSDYMVFLKDMPLEFEPGSESIHSNTGYEVLGAVIEAVTGQDYYDYIRDSIYAQAGMANSDSYARDSVVENMATGYTNIHPYDERGQGYRWANTLMLSPTGTPAGGGYSTAGDMLRFANALKKYDLLNARYTGLLLNRFEGFADSDEPAGRIAYAGGAPGVSAYLSMDLERDETVIVLSNYDSPIAIEIGRTIGEMLDSLE
ncbi:MAG: serine hydrolase domain-containing protein [bacterium]|jgi:CubicO group peptidase (beta-lactamase class C family)